MALKEAQYTLCPVGLNPFLAFSPAEGFTSTGSISLVLGHLPSSWVWPMGATGGRLDGWRKRETRLFLFPSYCLRQCLCSCLFLLAPAPELWKYLLLSTLQPRGGSIFLLLLISKLSYCFFFDFCFPSHM